MTCLRLEGVEYSEYNYSLTLESAFVLATFYEMGFQSLCELPMSLCRNCSPHLEPDFRLAAAKCSSG